jgi:hypothetical protein
MPQTKPNLATAANSKTKVPLAFKVSPPIQQTDGRFGRPQANAKGSLAVKLENRPFSYHMGLSYLASEKQVTLLLEGDRTVDGFLDKRNANGQQHANGRENETLRKSTAQSMVSIEEA